MFLRPRLTNGVDLLLKNLGVIALHRGMLDFKTILLGLLGMVGRNIASVFSNRNMVHNQVFSREKD